MVQVILARKFIAIKAIYQVAALEPVKTSNRLTGYCNLQYDTCHAAGHFDCELPVTQAAFNFPIMVIRPLT
jgi:hypothetical protein